MDAVAILEFIKIGLFKEGRGCVLRDGVSYYFTKAELEGSEESPILKLSYVDHEGEDSQKIYLNYFETWEAIYGYELGCTVCVDLIEKSKSTIIKELEGKIKYTESILQNYKDAVKVLEKKQCEHGGDCPYDENPGRFGGGY